MRRIIVRLMVAAVLAVMVLLTAGGPALARTAPNLPGATCNFGTFHAHEGAVREGLPAHEHIPCEPPE